MRVLVLGGTGFIGARLCALLADAGHAPVAAGRRAGGRTLGLDIRDEAALRASLRRVDAVVNCVAGGPGAIAAGAASLARAARSVGLRQLVHVSSLAVYGDLEGEVDESAPLSAPATGWYARAKRQAEAALLPLAQAGTAVTVLRPGCVWGPGSRLWVERIAGLLVAGRLGDLGAGGDGWSNGVHVDDVARAALAALRADADADADASSSGRAARSRVYNLAAPDSPRWNAWFCDLALAIGATPLRRVPASRLRLDAWLAGAPLHALRRLRGRGPWPVSPGLPALFARQLRLDATAATRQLGLTWTAYPTSLHQGAAWWLAQRAAPTRAGWVA
ncbi:NAD-dependent epimerase/dehydratase family protein [Ramlibacter sp. MAHUQ-53]|uniref:NAD-dependent epimerase/dehydratase family protein n=1 Tax=unclassified Ramlibacter TaxID=2617605 RepID=UPI0036282005